MNEIDYTNTSLTTKDRNDIGDEFNVEYLSNTQSNAGERVLKYSKNQAEETVKEQAVKTATAPSPVAVTSGVTAGAVVVATAVIYTSLLGNKFVLVDNSLALNPYKDWETNEVFLDYSFDIQYDRSGSVFVKMIAPGENLSSEPYVLEYDVDMPEEMEGEVERDEPIKKEKVILTQHISGTFPSLREGNDYTFAITSFIDNTESTVYTQKVHIPSSYAVVYEGSYELYEEEGVLSLYYSLPIEYEQEMFAYVQLKRFTEEQTYVIEQESEKQLLPARDHPTQDDFFFLEGEFKNLLKDEYYTISVICENQGNIFTPYSQEFYSYIEPDIPSEEYHVTFAEDAYVDFQIEEGELNLAYLFQLLVPKEATLRLNLYDEDTSQLLMDEDYFYSPLEDSQVLEGNYPVQPGKNYRLALSATIDHKEELLFENTYIYSESYGYIDEDNTNIEAITYTNMDGVVTHKLNVSLSHYCSLTVHSLYMKVYNVNQALLAEESLAVDLIPTEEVLHTQIDKTFTLEQQGPYRVEIYQYVYDEELIYQTEIEEVEAQAYDVNEDNLHASVITQDGVAKIAIEFASEDTRAGHIQYEITKLSDNTIQNTPLLTIEEASYYEFDLSDVTSDYTLKVYSIINESVLVYTTQVETTGIYAEYDEDFHIQSLNTGSGMVYSYSFQIMPELTCQAYVDIRENDSIIYSSNVLEITYEEGGTISGENISLEEGKTYTFTSYAYWGREFLKLTSQEYTATSYGIHVDEDSVTHDYETETLTVPFTLNDSLGYLSELEASVSILGTDGKTNTYPGTLVDSSFVFSVEGATKGIAAELIIKAQDSQNSSQTKTTFVHIAIWY